MSGPSPSKEKFCSIIGEIVDKTCDIIVDTEEALDYDAVELTVLLKTIGFRLNSFEFESNPDPDCSDISIDINCKRSGITSKLHLCGKKCTCPERSKEMENNNSYWEVQGRGPQTPISRFKGIVKDTSCDLLPDVSRRSVNIARTTLAMLLQNFQNDFSPDKCKDKNIDVKTFADYLNIKLPNNGEINSASRTTSLSSIVENDVQLQKSRSVNDLNSLKTNGHTGSLVSINGVNEGCENGKHENNSDNLSTFPSLQPEKTESNEFNFEFDYEPNEKDRNIVQRILRARKSLDVALNLIKTKPSQMNMNQLSEITFTQISATTPNPRTARTPLLKTRRSVPNMPTGRRSSLGGSIEATNKSSPITPKTTPKFRLIKRDSFKSTENTPSPPKSTTIRRTSSGTNLRPVSNLTKGHVTKTNVTKYSNIAKKI